MSKGINRIRLEFKVNHRPMLHFYHYRVLIESDWNLKFFVATCFAASE